MRVIVHFSSVHPRTDVRIRYKQVATLARALGDEVRFYVQDGLGDEVDLDGRCAIMDTGAPLPRLKRMVVGAWRITRAVRKARPRIAHFHDPELLPWAILLKFSGVKVIYDVHEDVPRQIRHNPRLPTWVRPLLPPVASFVEWAAALCLDGVVAATPEIARRFPSRKTVLVQNYPILSEHDSAARPPQSARPRDFAYIGGLTGHRGLFGIVDAIGMVADGARLRLAGAFVSESEALQARGRPGWLSVDFEGWLGRGEVADLLSQVRAGLVTLHPLRNYVEARPVKLFEYMAAGLPVVASDFPRWREIIEGAGCGLLVDPLDASAIARAMEWVLAHPDEAQKMGERGYQAVMEIYNWDVEAKKLVAFYSALLATDADAVAPTMEQCLLESRTPTKV